MERSHAIVVNTSYELTGAQVKDLANKIKAKAADNTFVGATSAAPGSKGLVPQPQAGDNEKFLSGDGTWKTVNNDANSITYYIQKQSTAGMSSYLAFIYTDSNRTIPADPAVLVANFNAGKTILLEYEQNGVTEPYNITFQVNSVSTDGDPAVRCQYKLLISELNNFNGNYNAVTTQLSATVKAGTTFNGRWGVVRAVIPSMPDVPNLNYYSYEQDTGLTWVNGKPIYKKTVDTGTMPNSTRKTVAHGISNLGFIISMSGAAYGNSTYLPIPYADTTAANSLGLYASSTDLIIFTSQNMSYLTTSYVTLYYTKTTD